MSASRVRLTIRRQMLSFWCGEQRSLVSLSVDTLESTNKVSTDNVDTSSAIVQLVEEIDESAPHVRRRLPATRCGEQRSPVSLSVDTLESTNKVSTDNADTPSVLYSSRRRSTSRRHMSDDVFLRQGVESHALLSLSVDVLDSFEQGVHTLR